jgi:hypothetical protein
MNDDAAVRTNGADVIYGGNGGGDHPWPWRSGLVTRTEGLRSLPIPIHSEVVTFLLGDLIGRNVRVSSAALGTDIEPGRVTILTDQEGRIVDLWVDPDPEDQ